MPCETFPIATPTRINNPAIWLFGNRLFHDQSPLEFLSELLLVMASPKRLKESRVEFGSIFPSCDVLHAWRVPDELQYAPKARLNLKLFALMGASRLDSRHETHRTHYQELLERLAASIRVAEPGTEGDVLRTLENLLLGFHGAGSGRTWCAQSFLPLCPELTAAETIWNETAARRERPLSWTDLLQEVRSYFASSKRLFLARGGEVLYLQLCHALRQSPESVAVWVRESKLELTLREQSPVELHTNLERALGSLLGQSPRTLRDIVEFIDTGVETATSTATDMESATPRFVDAGSCASESWQEGYLFAVDLLRLCEAGLDVIERLRMLETACAMQVLRTLCAQSARHSRQDKATEWPGYRFALSAPDETNAAVKRLSRHTARLAERLIYHAVRSEDVPPLPHPRPSDKDLKEADRRYGSKLFTAMAKRIGLLVPRRGAGARFTLDERLLRYLVVTTIPVGSRLTYERFKALVEARHGLVADGGGLARASRWADGAHEVSFGDDVGGWLREMLSAAGMLITLSDSCSLVENPAAQRGRAR